MATKTTLPNAESIRGQAGTRTINNLLGEGVSLGYGRKEIQLGMVLVEDIAMLSKMLLKNFETYIEETATNETFWATKK